MKLTAKKRTAANNRLADFCRRRHDSIPATEIGQIVQEETGLVSEDGIFCGRQGRSTDELRTEDTNQPCENSMLVMTWYKGDHDGQFEIVAYLS